MLNLVFWAIVRSFEVGDLAVEVGFENLPIIREDILCMCETAHIPVLLVTQMLETIAEWTFH